MRAFEVHLNNKRICVAGIGDHGVLSAIINYVGDEGGDEMGLSVGGLITAKNEHIRWIKSRKLRPGDEVRVKIVEVESVDKPRDRYRRDLAQEMRERKRYVREAAKRFGWTISARRSRH
jgi:hypothetical protein